ncbi:hypothetical protein IAQ61_000705 [Plenodomus lingam]|nr:hypothetical protein IAQ61_000705 [Plenodomus lingam]
MSGVMCVWATLPEEALDWYENEYLPERTNAHSKSTIYCEATESGLDSEPIGHLGTPWELMSVYEVEDIKQMSKESYDKKTHPPKEMMNGILKGSRFDVKTCREIARWGGDHWDGDVNRITSVTAMEWRIPKEEEEEVITFYTKDLAPMVAESEDVLRFRLFEVENATFLEGENYVTKEKDSLHTYFTLVEFETDEWPWDKIMQLSENPKWRRYFESQEIVKWQTSHYMVNRAYLPEQSSKPDEEDSKAST